METANVQGTRTGQHWLTPRQSVFAIAASKDAPAQSILGLLILVIVIIVLLLSSRSWGGCLAKRSPR